MKKEHGMYKNEVERPATPAWGHQEGGMGLDGFKDEGADIAMGQAGRSGMKSDEKKINGQFKHYGWEGTSEY